MLEVKNVKKSFENKKILKSISFSVEEGEVFGFLGNNGVGKTTLFNSISSFIKFEGEILLNKKKINPANISFLKTSTYFYPYMKAIEYFSFFENDKKSAINLSNIFNLPLDEYIHDFSTGMKKKTAIIGNIILNKPVLIMDEPFNGLDLESIEKLYLIIDKLKRQGVIILISSHILETLIKCCNKIAHLKNGKIQNIYEDFNFDKLESKIRNRVKENWDELIKNA
jgi:ABC-2 type transport system ATP-binding protein